MMNCNSKRHQGDCRDRDRLSELPDDILVHILTLLPIKDAVRTVLLRRFGELWTLLPTLNFQKYARASRKYISNVMRYHKNPTIDMFKIVDCPDYLFYVHKPKVPLDQHLKKCTHFALRKKTKALIVVLEAECSASRYFVPPLVFRNQCLIRLELSGMDIKLPRRVFMGSLRTLELVYVFISDESFRELISGCPCLQELIFRCSYGFEQLHFTAPSIERLELVFSEDRYSDAPDRYYSLDCPNLKILYIEDVFMENLKLIDVSSVRKATITNCCAISVDDNDTIAGAAGSYVIQLKIDCDYTLIVNVYVADVSSNFSSNWNPAEV